MAKRSKDEVKTLIDALREGGWDADSYSGRFMYGIRCVSVRTGEEEVSAWEIARHLFSEEYDGQFSSLPEPKQDQMGLGIVLYWPSYQWPEGE